MKTTINWKDAMEFEATAGQHIVRMDAKAPIGKDSAPTPKELVAMGLGGCTAMDVIALLKKYKQPPQSFQIDVEIQPSTSGHPIVFEKAIITFVVNGNVDVDKLIEAVNLSQTKYCGVSAMLSKSLPIEYKVVLNGAEIGFGSANFETNKKESI
jgi:putative redox protein